MNPTEEQQQAIDLFLTGESLAIEAGAGTGKTSTLRLLAGSDSRRGRYMAFNRGIVDEAKRSMPANVKASTAHGLAFASVGKRFKHRLDSGRMTSNEIARRLGIGPMWVKSAVETKVLQPDFLAGQVMAAANAFCQSADLDPGVEHFGYIDGIDLPDEVTGYRTSANNDEVRRTLLPALHKAWADLSNVDGHLRFSHAVYLKLFELGNPVVPGDYLMVDEAQDLSPVMISIAAQQTGMQVIFVGDSQQAIYSFTGARNALATVPVVHRSYLSQSFRFGPPIAEVANWVLAELEAVLRLKGLPSIQSRVGPVARPSVVLTRTNARAVVEVLRRLETGVRCHLVGGGREVVAFAKAAEELQETGKTWHPELRCFSSWDEVLTYTELDALGGELKLMVKLVEDFGVGVIVEALERMPSAERADMLVSTAHKSKGLQWPSVQIADDFPDPDDRERPPSDEEYRLAYVAATRAERELDVSACRMLDQYVTA